jgi:YbbR domain-containing protein
MAENPNKSLMNRIKRIFKFGIPPGTNEVDARAARRERIVVFIVAFIMALSLWFIVNLNGDYNISVNIPLEPGSIPDDMALVEDLPEFVQVEVSGDGWKLVSLYNNPPRVLIDINEGEVNLFDQVRQRFSVEQDVSVLKVQPFAVDIALEEKVSKKIPIRLNTEISFMNRYGLVSAPQITPDSLVITGAESQVEDINEWLIGEVLVLSDVRENISAVIPIEETNPLIESSVDEVTFTADVSEFTEGEVSVYIRTRDLPRGEVINYNPSAVSIRFDVPIELYSEVQNMRPYEAYVPYSEIQEDSTGFVTPDIELIATEYNIKLRSFQPKAVAYFSVVDQ